jgi:hypothetical protein
VGLQSLDSKGPGLFDPIGVDLNAIAMCNDAVKQVCESHSIADTGIERRKALREAQPILETFSLRYPEEGKSLAWFGHEGARVNLLNGKCGGLVQLDLKTWSGDPAEFDCGSVSMVAEACGRIDRPDLLYQVEC